MNMTRKLAETIVDDVVCALARSLPALASIRHDAQRLGSIHDSVDATIRMHSAPLPDGAPASRAVARALVQTDLEALAALIKTVSRVDSGVHVHYRPGNGAACRWDAESGSYRQAAATLAEALAALRKDVAADAAVQLAQRRRELAELAEALGGDEEAPEPPPGTDAYGRKP